jgi:hypothetical protein
MILVVIAFFLLWILLMSALGHSLRIPNKEVIYSVKCFNFQCIEYTHFHKNLLFYTLEELKSSLRALISIFPFSVSAIDKDYNWQIIINVTFNFE